MKTLTRYLSAAVALGALLAFAGCNTQTARAVPSRTSYQVTVVENSKGLKLTEQQAAEIRNSAVAFLKENGISGGGEFFVKVNLTPGSPEETDQWVVLKISSLPTRTYTLLAVYPGPDDSYPFDYYYNNGGFRYRGFAGYGYYDPFDYGYSNGYYGGGYSPPVLPPSHNYKPGDKDNHKPGDKDNHPPATHTRWDGNKPDNNGTPSNSHPPRSDTTRTWNRDRSNDGNSGSRWSGNRNSDSSSSSGSGSSYSSSSGSSSSSSSSSGSSSSSSYSPPASSYSPPSSSYSAPAPSQDPSSSRNEQRQPE